uniref:Cathepsin L2 n=1 Tax=Dugesia japonica TaxID=6161 RepID=A0A2U8U447_DUGJA|nr:cathepsin L2 [Dugesia japonica]
MKIILLTSIFLVTIQAVPHKFTINSELNDEWEVYKMKFSKKYETLNEISRRIIWENNLKFIQQHNVEYDLGKHTYYLGLNEFADMTHEEFKAKYLGLKPINRNFTSSRFIIPENIGDLPTRIDWRTKGYVTPVKNQGQCGSCWAFSTTGSLEGQHFRKSGKLVSFSEQQLVDCSRSFDNLGCNGGLMDNAFSYIQKFGIENEISYPYVANDGVCAYDKTKIVGTCTGFVDIKTGNETDLMAAVATQGPISVAIDASNDSFQFYRGGIYNEPHCSSKDLDHGVLAIGYGSENNENYWIVKNSWDISWGMSGYIRMSKDKMNQCGIATMASYPLV